MLQQRMMSISLCIAAVMGDYHSQDAQNHQTKRQPPKRRPRLHQPAKVQTPLKSAFYIPYLALWPFQKLRLKTRP